MIDEDVHTPSTRLFPLEDWSLTLGRLLSFASLILAIIWARGEDVENNYLGGLNWEKFVFNFHPVLMIAGFVCTGFSVTAFRIKWLKPNQQRNMHLTFHMLAKILLSIGLRAVYLSKMDKYGSYELHLVSLHSWVGTLTAVVLFGNDFMGGVMFILPYLASHRKSFKPYHFFFGKIAIFLVLVTLETGQIYLYLFLLSLLLIFVSLSDRFDAEKHFLGLQPIDK
jgi:hypothetical protein